DFISKSGILAPLIRSRFEAYRSLLAEFGTDPMTSYLEHEGIYYDRLIDMVQRLGDMASGPFRESLSKYSTEIVGRPAEYYDYYFFKSRIFRKYATTTTAPTRREPIPSIIRTMKWMGLDASTIAVDEADRKGKSASAFCSAIKVPTDVRISYRKAVSLEDFAS